jgi:hypothetical protein
MIELNNDGLVFSFDEVHDNARISIDFQRTLRIPDDGKSYALPPGLGRFPIRHVDDFAERVPEAWRRHGGVMLPMYQAEALWLHFGGGGGVFYGPGGYPFAVKVATGKINAVNGEAWADGLNRDPQDYMVAPNQPWLDGYCVEKGLIRQFVAMPLGAGYSAEEQLTGEAEFGGIQVVAYPMKREAYERKVLTSERHRGTALYATDTIALGMAPASADMGLAPGGRMRQEIYDDPYELSDWDLRHGSRCFVHLANALVWRAITGEDPPTTPPTAAEYTRAGLPWFEYYGGDQGALDGAGPLKSLLSVLQMGKKKGDVPLPENTSVGPTNVVKLGKTGVVREGTF